jgi:hypothetical protein
MKEETGRQTDIVTDGNGSDCMRKYVHRIRKRGYLEDQDTDRAEIDNRIRY